MSTDEQEAPKAIKKRGTVKTEVVIGAAAVKLNNALKQVTSAITTLGELNTNIEDLSLKVAAKEAEIKELETKFQEQKRAGAIDVEASIKEHGTRQAEAVLLEAGRVTIEQVELDKLLALKTDFDTQVRAEAQKGISAATSSHNHAMALKEAEFKTKEAETNAKLTQSQSQITFLTTQVEDWKNQLVAERAASVERSKASAVGSIQVGQK